MKIDLTIFRRFLHSITRQINRYYITKLQAYSQAKVLTLPAYVKMYQSNPALVICLILLTVNWSLISIGLCILLMLIEEIILILLVVTSRYNFNYLCNFQWNKVSEQTNSFLQFIKYSRMIELGYELRANTNIILHEQKQNGPFYFKKFNERQYKLQIELIKIEKSLFNLYSFVVKQFSIKNNPLKQIRFPCYPLNFRTIFELNHNVGIMFTQLQSTNKIYTSFVNNQLSKFVKIVKVIYFIRFSFKNQLQQIKQSLKIIQYEIEQQLKSVQNSKLFYSLKKQQEYQQLQQILHRFSYDNEAQMKQNVSRVDQVIEINANQQKQIKKEKIQPNQNTVQNYQQRKNFMAKLDSLLVIGLARKRQQELEQKLRMQQQSQEHIQTKQQNQ